MASGLRLRRFCLKCKIWEEHSDMADKADPKLAAARLKHGPPTSGTAGYRLRPEHRHFFKNAVWACKHLADKRETPNLEYYLSHIEGELRAFCAECRPNIQNAQLIIAEK